MVDITAQSIIIAGIGVPSLALGIRNYRTQKQAIKDSTSVMGTVIEIEIEERSPDPNNTSYYPRIEYEYEYRGDSYTGDSLYPGSLGRGLDSRGKAKDVLDEFEEGGQISLFVNEDDPSQSFVFRETTTFRNVAAIVVGLFFIFFGIFIAL